MELFLSRYQSAHSKLLDLTNLLEHARHSDDRVFVEVARERAGAICVECMRIDADFAKTLAEGRR